MIGSAADWAWCRFLLFLGVLVEPCERIELGNLFLVLDGVLGQKGSYFPEISKLVIFEIKLGPYWWMGGVPEQRALTSDFVIDLDQVEGLAAEGATVCFDGPFSQTGIVENVIADLNNSDVVIVVQLVFGGFRQMHQYGICIGGGNGGGGVVDCECVRCEGSRSQGKRRLSEVSGQSASIMGGIALQVLQGFSAV